MTKRLPPDAEKLIGLCLASYVSGSRTEDRFWEAQTDALVAKILRQGNQAALDAALERLQQNHPGAYSVLADIADAHSESLSISHENRQWDAILIAAPVLAWTRYTIPLGPLKADTVNALHTHLQAHILADGVRLALAPYLYSIDQLPEQQIETYRLTQQFAQAALERRPIQLPLNLRELPELAPVLADPRFLLAVATAPAGQALFRWQEEESGIRIERSDCLKQWAAQGGANFAQALPGCELECLLPDAYHAACRTADEKIRPHTLRTAVRYLNDTLAPNANGLRAVIAGFGEHRVDEYRIGFTQRGDNAVLYGIVWPLYGHEDIAALAAEQDETANSPLDDIIALLKEANIVDIRRHAGRFDPEYCEDCNGPLYANPLGEIVHAEMPADIEPAQPHFH